VSVLQHLFVICGIVTAVSMTSLLQLSTLAVKRLFWIQLWTSTIVRQGPVERKADARKWEGRSIFANFMMFPMTLRAEMGMMETANPARIPQGWKTMMQESCQGRNRCWMTPVGMKNAELKIHITVWAMAKSITNFIQIPFPLKHKINNKTALILWFTKCRLTSVPAVMERMFCRDSWGWRRTLWG